MPTSKGNPQRSLKRACRPSNNDLSAAERAAYRTPPHSADCQPQQPQEADAAESERQSRIAEWDGLSKIWLTYRALRELDWRNKRASKDGKVTEGDRPSSGLSIPKDSLLDLSRFARGGGPDLQDLRGVSTTCDDL
jgi:hypothetical protein